jgi:nucleotide-binding universal stress UspA family protein
MFRKILLAYDGSEGANRALEVALAEARVHQAELWALAVEERLPRFSATVDEVQEEKTFANQHYGKLLAAAQARAQEAGIEVKTLLRAGHPAKTIIDVAKEGNFDLLLIGASGLSGLWRFLGTTTEKVVRHAPCSVVIVRPGEEEEGS